jgi:hypothetical protein
MDVKMTKEEAERRELAVRLLKESGLSWGEIGKNYSPSLWIVEAVEKALQYQDATLAAQLENLSVELGRKTETLTKIHNLAKDAHPADFGIVLAHIQQHSVNVMVDPITLVSVKKLAALWPPFSDLDSCWGRPTRSQITKAIREDKASLTSEVLAEKVAWFVINGWQEPIQVDVGIPHMRFRPAKIVTDGNHRLAAAVYRKDRYIPAVVSGETSVIESLTYKEPTTKQNTGVN